MKMRVFLLSLVAAVGIMASYADGAVMATISVSEPTIERGFIFRECKNCPEMVVIPAGQRPVATRIFNDHPEDPAARPPSPGEDVPEHVVSIQDEFAVGRYPVTKAEYSEFAQETNRKTSLVCRSSDGLQWEEIKGTDWQTPGFPQTPHDPVVCVSWEDANAYVHWLNSRSRGQSRLNDAGEGPYRLLTLSEAEYISATEVQKLKNGGASRFHDAGNFGSDRCDPCKGYVGGRDQWHYTSPVGSFPPNEFGLYDVIGNVWQLTDTPYPDEHKQPQEIGYRMAIGASWLDRPSRVLTPALSGLADVESLYDIGFRVARTLKGNPISTVTQPFPATPTPTTAMKVGSHLRDCNGCPELIVIPPGSFYRHPPDDSQTKNPISWVTISHPLAVGIYDVTKSEYAQFVKETGYAKPGACQVNEHGDWWVPEADRGWRDPGFVQSDRDPVTCVSWEDAHAYIDWLNQKAGFAENAKNDKGPSYRLPSGGEWEYLARGGNVSIGQTFYWGRNPSHDFANYGLEMCGVNCGGKTEASDKWLYTSPVGSFAPNSLGIYDGFGNVWQFTDDCFHANGSDNIPSDGSAWESGGNCHFRLARGASYDDEGPGYGTDEFAVDVRNNANGFRVVRTLQIGTALTK